MKKRTLIIAWVFLVVMGYQSIIRLLAIPGTYVHIHRLPWWFLWQIAPDLLQVPFWSALTRQKRWAWWPLVVILGLMLTRTAVSLVRMPVYCSAHPAMLHDLPRLLAWGVGMVLVMFALPLWTLLTDRPSRWANPQSGISVQQWRNRHVVRESGLYHSCTLLANDCAKMLE